MGRRRCIKGVSEIGFAITIATDDPDRVWFRSPHRRQDEIHDVEFRCCHYLDHRFAWHGTHVHSPKRLSYDVQTSRRHIARRQDRSLRTVLSAVLKRFYEATFERFNRLQRCVKVLHSPTRSVHHSYNPSRRDISSIRWPQPFPKTGEVIRYFNIDVRFPDHYSMDQRLAYFRKVSDARRKQDVYGLKAHEVHYGSGMDALGFFAHDRVYELTRDEAIDKLYEDFSEPGVRVRYRGKEGSERKDGERFMHHIRLVGDDSELLDQVATDIQPMFEMIPGVMSFLDKGSDDAPASWPFMLIEKKQVRSA